MLPGDEFERYTVEGVLGRGGMGCVYRAHDPKLGRDVAIKVLLPRSPGDAVSTPSDESKARMLREARAAASLSHPNAVSIYDVGEHATAGPYIVMELVQGRSLRDASRDPDATLRDKVRWLTETASALAAAHARGIVHRDVKPENVIVRTDGVAKVLDFGIARRAATEADPSAPTEAPLPTLTEHGAQIGTPLYMAPEQIKGDPIDGRADQFAWGVVAYEALAGKLPWRIDKGQLGAAASILTDTPAPIYGVPDDVQAVVMRALEKDPKARFGSMRELIDQLTAHGDRPATSLRSTVGSDAPRASAPEGPSRPATGEGTRETARAALEKPFSDARRYDTVQFKEIFQRALDKQEREGKYGRDDLAAAARELGIRDDVLAATLAEEDASEAAPPERNEGPDRGREVRKLARSAVTFAIINFVCYFWLHLNTRWVLYGTLIALAIQMSNVLFPKEGGASRESRRERRRRMREERRATRRGRAAEPGRDEDLDEDVRILLGTTEKRARVRVAAPDAGGRDEAIDAEKRAEAEAAALDEAQAVERRRVSPKADRSS